MKYIFAVAILVGAVSGGSALSADEPVSVSIYPSVAVARGEAHLRIVVERNDQNRALSWEVDGPGYYRSSTARLEGAESPRSWFFAVKDLAPGNYTVRATLKRSNNSESVASTKMRVIGAGAN